LKTVFVDTSGFYAALDRTDPFHAVAAECFRRATAENWHLVTSNYVVHETWALVQHRLGWDGVDAFLDGLLPLCEVLWVDAELHQRAADLCASERQRLLSLTDCISFELMRRSELNEAIARDKHFTEKGVRLP
jgi:predicted nucleic acid-binding protein